MKRNFIYLAAITVIALALLVVYAPREPSGKPESNELLLPAMAAKINEVDRVEIVTAGAHTVATLLRSGDRWQLQEMSGYRADWPQLQSLLADLAQARVVEQKTDNPAYYARLGVEDIASEDATGTLVRLSAGEQAAAVLVGNRATGRSGRYVRLADAAASALVDRDLDVPERPGDWVESRIVDINSSDVAEVEVIHPQGERVLATKISADQTDFELVGMPADRELKSSWAVNSLGSVFSLLNLETVMPAGGADWSDAVKLRLLTFSGIEILADATEADGQYLLRLRASHPAANVVRPQDSDQAETPAADNGEGQGNGQADAEQQAMDDVADSVAEINERVQGWVYGISKSKYEAMAKKPEDLLKPLESS